MVRMKQKFEMDVIVQDQGTMEDTEKVFNDAVHGAISLHPLCVRVVDTPQFQRLRFLKTVGPVYFVFPAAAHNRFEHSLGVCHLAGQLARALRARQPDLKITDCDILCVQLAGLCHDLGHGPFSHLWEVFVNKARPGKNWAHESASLDMFDYLLDANNLHGEFQKYGLRDQDLKFIKELIGGPKSTDGANWPYEGRPREKAFLYEIVANKRSGVDVDKWDYFLRDGHSLGIKVTFDYHRLVKFSRVIDVPGEGLQICFREKEVDSLYDMFHARRTLHRTAYQHRVVKTIDSMLVDAFCYADEHIQYKGRNGKKYNLADVCDDMYAYTNLVDDVFHQIIRAEGDHPDLLKAKETINRILTRQLYAYVGHTQPISGGISKETLIASLESNIPSGSLTKEDLDIQEVRLNYGMGDKDPIECVRFYSKNNPTDAKTLSREEVSNMLPQSFQEVVYRFVIKSYDERHYRDAQKMFKESCKQLNMKEPSVDSWPRHLTPVKNYNGHCANGQGAPVDGSAVQWLNF
ncbi:deoxynucleoside triphosphate triphosphohydrolase SAMHD1 isoform X2 [Macrobrachium rosenbergii]|uniref:deoxynucleoside triphosphate triphosphohydrolase SAMHD1 isoform X2 n=2 Tax=Macrobrachium rosenbergii TaxID=79674 RepID=UPI0034D76CCD